MKRMELTIIYDRFNITKTLTKECYDYIVNLTSANVEDGVIKLETDPTTAVCAIFALCYEDKYAEIPWDVMEEYKEEIDYGVIKKCEYFKIDTEHLELQRWFRDQNIIDDKEYAYYEVTSLECDIDFWKEYFKSNNCKSASDCIDLVIDAYNGLDLRDANCVDDEVGEIITDYIQPDEKLDKYFDVFVNLFNAEVIECFVIKNAFEDSFRMISYLGYWYGKNYGLDVIMDFWKEILGVLSTNYEYNDPRFSGLVCNDDMLIGLIIALNEYCEFHERWNKFDSDLIKYRDHIMSILINSKDAPYYFSTIQHTLVRLSKMPDSNYVKITAEDIDKYLLEGSLDIAPAYHMLLSDVKTNKYFAKFYASPNLVVYDKTKNIVRFGDSIYDANEFANLSIWQEFYDDNDYHYHKMTDYEKTLKETMCKNDDEIFEELMRAIYDLTVIIKS